MNDVTPLIEAAREHPHTIVVLSKPAFTDSAEYLLLIVNGWVVQQYDGAVSVGEAGELIVRQVAHLEKRVPFGEAVAAWLKERGMDLS